MQGLVNFTTAIADGISVMLPAFCYFMALSCFMFFAWTLFTWSQPHRHHHHHWHRHWHRRHGARHRRHWHRHWRH